MPPRGREELINALMKEIDPSHDPGLYNDTRQAFERATDDQLSAWYNQQNDPGQARDSSWARNAATESRLPEISDTARDEIMKEISHDLESLEHSLNQAPDQQQEQEHEHER